MVIVLVPCAVINYNSPLIEPNHTLTDLNVSREIDASISCFKNLKETLPDLSTVETDWKKSLYFLEVSCRSSNNERITILPRQACAIESAAFTHPDFDVHVVYASSGVIKNQGSLSDYLIQILSSYKNVKFLHFDIMSLVNGSTVESLYQQNKVESAAYPMIATSDISRLLILQKYGGTYLDLDVIVLKRLDTLPLNCVGLQSSSYVNNAVIKLSNDGAGQIFTQLCLEDLRDNFNGSEWQLTGPIVLTKVMKKMCRVDDVSVMPEANCLGFNVLPKEAFYPIAWQDCTNDMALTSALFRIPFVHKSFILILSFSTFVVLCYYITFFHYVYPSFQKSDHISALYCYELNYKTLPDISTKTAPWEKSIYFLEVSCKSSENGKISILPKQACAIKSAAFNNPSFDVYVVYTSPGTIVDGESISDQLLHILLGYKNIKFLHVDFKELIKNTPVEKLYKDGNFNNSNFPVIVSSDITRLLILQKYGGTYLDLDVIVLKSLLDLPSDYVGIMSEYYANNAVIRFSPNNISRLIIKKCLELLRDNFTNNQYDYSGPQVLNKVLADVCQDNKFLSTPFKDCNGFKILPPETFYYVPWEDWELFFKTQDFDELLKSILKKSYVVYVWNKMSNHVLARTKPNSLYNTLGKNFVHVCLQQLVIFSNNIFCIA
ncbi:hypothetical protein RN001_014014 [Aquatica leii]|uniref:Alpha 1,4-glycosyltransferase domain-containing protein n=1 Tax=Aquatica leii TaxID=1421715 RepID=A0AAN7PRB1_9COLE|nr:hypothetical protein RN001_014014 [Aquatica leii]